MRLVVVSYLRDTDPFPESIYQFYLVLKRLYPACDFLLFTSQSFDVDPSIILIREVGTKYSKIFHLMNHSNYDYILSIDNDITINQPVLVKSTHDSIERNMDFTYGRIEINTPRGLLPGLVMIDKYLSHYILRPISWRLKFGISIPGQVFLFKVEKFKSILPTVDSYLDDLAFGLTLRKNISSIKMDYSRKVFGFESPNTTIKGLSLQRKRWATGFMQLYSTLSSRDRIYLRKHAVLYHFSWMIIFLLMVIFYFISPWLTLSSYFIWSLFISKFKVKYLPIAMIYVIVFPYFHLVWIKHLRSAI